MFSSAAGPSRAAAGPSRAQEPDPPSLNAEQQIAVQATVAITWNVQVNAWLKDRSARPSPEMIPVNEPTFIEKAAIGFLYAYATPSSNATGPRQDVFVITSSKVDMDLDFAQHDSRIVCPATGYTGRVREVFTLLTDPEVKILECSNFTGPDMIFPMIITGGAGSIHRNRPVEFIGLKFESSRHILRSTERVDTSIRIKQVTDSPDMPAVSIADLEEIEAYIGPSSRPQPEFSPWCVKVYGSGSDPVLPCTAMSKVLFIGAPLITQRGAIRAFITGDDADMPLDAYRRNHPPGVPIVRDAALMIKTFSTEVLEIIELSIEDKRMKAPPPPAAVVPSVGSSRLASSINNPALTSPAILSRYIPMVVFLSWHPVSAKQGVCQRLGIIYTIRGNRTFILTSSQDIMDFPVHATLGRVVASNGQSGTFTVPHSMELDQDYLVITTDDLDTSGCGQFTMNSPPDCYAGDRADAMVLLYADEKEVIQASSPCTTRELLQDISPFGPRRYRVTQATEARGTFLGALALRAWGELEGIVIGFTQAGNYKILRFVNGLLKDV